jgi:hypothetical protein
MPISRELQARIEIHQAKGSPLSRMHQAQEQDLMRGLGIAYKDGGAYSTNTDYRVTLDIDSECEL